MKASRVLCSALLLVGALSGCGSDNPVSSLETDPAFVSPPTNLRSQGFLLQWDPSPDADVVGYEVEADRLDQEVAFVAVTTRPSSLTAYDVSTGSAEFMDTWYRVRAVDADGNRSAATRSVFVASGSASTEDPTTPEDPSIVRPVRP